jgi:hypothetical protein
MVLRASGRRLYHSPMKREYLGDSYDAVKRLWQQALLAWAPLYAEPRFIPKDLQDEFTCLTCIPMLPDAPSEPYSILNDPDTGIRLPAENNQAESRTHTALRSIGDQLQRPGLRVVITYDQSDYRHSDLTREQQRHTKMRFLAEAGLFAFYYVSHAPFLFAFPDAESERSLRERLQSFGIPGNRFEFYERSG